MVGAVEGEVVVVVEEVEVEGGVGNVITGGGITVVGVSSDVSGSGMISLIKIGIRPMMKVHTFIRTYTILYAAGRGSGIFTGKLTAQRVSLVVSSSR